LEDFTSQEESSSKDEKDIKIRKGTSSKRTSLAKRRRNSQSMSQLGKNFDNVSIDENGKNTMEDENELLND